MKIIIAMMFTVCAAANAGSYQYIDIKIGTFFNPCYECYHPDGKLPAYIAVGHAWTNDQWEINAEFLHQSNADLGFPFGKKGEDEYYKNGFFVGARYKFHIFK